MPALSMLIQSPMFPHLPALLFFFSNIPALDLLRIFIFNYQTQFQPHKSLITSLPWCREQEGNCNQSQSRQPHAFPSLSHTNSPALGSSASLGNEGIFQETPGIQCSFRGFLNLLFVFLEARCGGDDVSSCYNLSPRTHHWGVNSDPMAAGSRGLLMRTGAIFMAINPGEMEGQAEKWNNLPTSPEPIPPAIQMRFVSLTPLPPSPSPLTSHQVSGGNSNALGVKCHLCFALQRK